MYSLTYLKPFVWFGGSDQINAFGIGSKGQFLIRYEHHAQIRWSIGVMFFRISEHFFQLYTLRLITYLWYIFFPWLMAPLPTFSMTANDWIVIRNRFRVIPSITITAIHQYAGFRRDTLRQLIMEGIIRNRFQMKLSYGTHCGYVQRIGSNQNSAFICNQERYHWRHKK